MSQCSSGRNKNPLALAMGSVNSEYAYECRNCDGDLEDFLCKMEGLLESFLTEHAEHTHEMQPLNITHADGVKLCFCKKCKQVFVE